MIKRNGFLYLIVFFLLLSLLANIYSFNKLSGDNQEYKDQIKELIKENDKIKTSEKNEVKSDKIEEDNESETDDKQEDIKSETDKYKNKLKDENNAVEKFIEYAFNTDNESYSTRKKLAKEYMTDDLYDTYFSSDSVDSDDMKLKVEVKEVEVFHGYDDDNAIVRYVVEESKAQGDYREEKEKYANIKLKNGKVSNIKALSNDEWGV